MHIAILEDHSPDRQDLQNMLNIYLAKASLSATYEVFDTAEALLKDFLPEKYDLIFLDIYLPGMQGNEAARHLRQMDPACRIIFLTTSTLHAIESYEVNASYYLIKPIDPHKLVRAMDLVCAELSRQSRYLTVHSSGVALQVPLGKIVFMECGNEGALLHLPDRDLDVDEGVRETADRLLTDPRFLCCNRNIVINMDWAIKMDSDAFSLKNGERVAIRKRGKGELKKVFLEYCVKRLKNEDH